MGHSRSKIRDLFGVRMLWIASATIDAFFLVLWVAVQWLANRCIMGMEISGPDRLVFAVFQWALFPICTLAPIAVWVYQDIRIMIIRAQRKIAEEKK
jgi:hypothetical protein